MKRILFIATVILAVFVLAACGSSSDNEYESTFVETDLSATNETQAPNITPAEPVVLTPAQIFENNKYAVFQIVAFGADDSGWFGSGFLIDSTGVAVTNHHVMIGAVEAYALMYDGSYFEITGYFSYDIDNDLAIIQVGNANDVFRYAILGNSDESMVGETVFAVGGPEGDPITFTSGMISRFANEPVSFDIYTIAGMIQSTAAIYGGNSGGPLLNDRGQVIGINSAGRADRASVQWAVPINRVAAPTGGAINQLPIGPAVPDHVEGRITQLARFNFIPDLTSVSRDVSLLMSGTPVDLGETSGLYYEFYDYLILYHVLEDYWISITDLYDIALKEHGFVFQNIVQWEGETWVYFFHPGHNVSLSYVFSWGYDILMVGIVRGNVYWEFYHAGGAQGVQIPDQLSLDPALIGIWEFWDTDNEMYHEWMLAGQHLFYVFDEDGTGAFYVLDASGDVIHEYSFYWGTDNMVVYIEYTDIDLLLVYFYEIDMHYGALFMADEEDEHILIFFE